MTELSSDFIHFHIGIAHLRVSRWTGDWQVRFAAYVDAAGYTKWYPLERSAVPADILLAARLELSE